MSDYKVDSESESDASSGHQSKKPKTGRYERSDSEFEEGQWVSSPRKKKKRVYRRRTPSPPRLTKRRRRTNRALKRVLIFMTDDSRQEKVWRPLFQKYRFKIYDQKYPFRKAARILCDPNHNFNLDPRAPPQTRQPIERLAQALYETTTNIVPHLPLEHFRHWLQSGRPQKKVVILGLRKEDAQALVAEGATVIGTVQHSECRFHVRNEQDLENYLHHNWR